MLATAELEAEELPAYLPPIFTTLHGIFALSPGIALGCLQGTPVSKGNSADEHMEHRNLKKEVEEEADE